MVSDFSNGEADLLPDEPVGKPKGANPSTSEGRIAGRIMDLFVSMAAAVNLDHELG